MQPKMIKRLFKQNKIELTLKESTILKGIAITLVVFHNYWHLINNSLLENEFTLKQENLYKFIINILEKPYNFIEPLSSFLGVYGVYIFIFISGYGLTEKIKTDTTINHQYKIIGKQITKTTILILTSIPIIFLVKSTQYKINIYQELRQCIEFLTLTSNFTRNIYTFVSVWWFIPLLFQLYLFFPIANILIKKYKYIPIIIILIISIISGYYNPEIIKNYNLYIFATPITLSSIFFFGIYSAHKNTYPNICIYISLFLLIPSLTSKYFFGISFFIITLLEMHLFQKLKRTLIKYKILYLIGINSPFIYIMHGETRLRLIKYANSTNDIATNYICFMLYLILIGCLVIIHKIVHKKITSKILTETKNSHCF